MPAAQPQAILNLVHICGAQTHKGGLCRRFAKPGELRCYYHGAGGGRPRGIPQHPNTRAAVIAGTKRYWERVRLGEIPGRWHKPKGVRRSKDPKIARAQRIVERVMAEKAARLPKPWSEMSRGERLSANADRALTVTKQFLDREIDPDDQKMVALQQQTALAVIGYQLRAETARLPSAAGSPAAPVGAIRIVVSADDPLLVDDGAPPLDLELAQ